MYPALSILQALASGANPNVNNAGNGPTLETLWVGGVGGMEADLVRRANIPFEAIPAAGVHGVGLKAIPGNLLRLAQGFFKSLVILRQFKPAVLLFTGGYVAVPMALASRLAFWLRRPRSLVYIPDIEPGLALKTLLHFSDHAALTVEPSRAFLPRRLPATVTGYPTRKELTQWKNRAEARAALNLADDLPVLLVMGGSKGARSINQALLAALPVLLPQMQVLHLTGQLDWELVQQTAAALLEPLQSNYHPYPYLHENMGAALQAADLVVSRAGASSLGEYPLFGLPAVLIPYPYAWRYQRVNADYLAQHGAALVLEDSELNTNLAWLVGDLLSDRKRLAAMRGAMSKLAHPAAAESIAQIVNEMAISA